MAAQVPTLIFVHGAWHTSEYWSLVTDAFETKGFRCLAPNLMYNGTGTAIQSTAPGVAELQGIVAAELDLGNDVVLVTHSFGGVFGCSAIKGLTGKDSSNLRSSKSGHVVGVVQLAAFAPPTGSSHAEHLTNMARRRPGMEKSRIQSRPNDKGWSVVESDAAQAFYNDLPLAEAQKWTAKLVGFSPMCRVSSDAIYAGWQDVPIWYLRCKLDRAVPVAVQEEIVQACQEDGANITSREIEASHSPMLSRPAEVAAFIEEAVAAFRA